MFRRSPNIHPANHKMLKGGHEFPTSFRPLSVSSGSAARPHKNMLRGAIFLLSFFSFLSTFAFASSMVIDHEVLQCTTKAFTSAWSETFNNFVGLTPNYTPGTFIAVDCTQIPNLRCGAIPEEAK